MKYSSLAIIKKSFFVVFIATHLSAATYELPMSGSQKSITTAVKNLYYNDKDMRESTELASVLRNLSLDWSNLCSAPQSCQLQVLLKRYIENPNAKGKIIQYGVVNLIVFLSDPRLLFINSKFTYIQGENLDSLVIDKPTHRIYTQSQ